MRFLLDVNVGSRIADALVHAGHDVVRAALTNRLAEDGELLAVAVAEDRILVTYDRDFSELIFRHHVQCPPAVIYIRYRPRDVEPALARLLDNLDFDALQGHMTVIDERHVRSTPFPARSNDNG